MEDVSSRILQSKLVFNPLAKSHEEGETPLMHLVARELEGDSSSPRYSVGIGFGVAVHGVALAIDEDLYSHAMTEDVMGLGEGQATGLSLAQVEDLFARFEDGQTKIEPAGCD